MNCEHDLPWQESDIYDGPACSVHVNCDEGCKALTDPQTEAELRAALEHWRSHSYLNGCSHGS
jgi:hypothetical protein